MPTKDELTATKPAADRETRPSDETKGLADKCASASETIKSAAATINSIAGDAKTSGKELESVGGTLLGLDWLPGLGGGLKSAGTALKSVGAALESNSDAITADAAALASELQGVAHLLDEANGALTALTSDLTTAEKVWGDAGAEFDSVENECASGFKEIEEKIADVAGEVEDGIVSAWNTLKEKFEGSHAKHADAAQAVDEKAKSAEANLSSNGSALSDAADKLTSLVAS
jgi:hypothetical protein